MTDIYTKPLSRISWPVVKVILVYVIFGFLWIFFSDSILASIVSSPEEFKHYSIYKGWAYILATSLLLYFLVHKTLKQQIKIKQDLKLSEARWNFSLDGASEAGWDCNLTTGEFFRSGQWHGIYGYEESDIPFTTQAVKSIIHPDDLPRVIDELRRYLAKEVPVFISEFRMQCKDGTWKWTLSRGMVVSSAPDGKPLRMIGTHTDISERKYSEAQIYRLAHYDFVTGLPNRTSFLNSIDEEIKKARRAEQPITLMYLDLDKFKEVNDTLGHDVGDLLLKEAATRLLSCVRETDTVARLGGDEFTIILNNLEDSGRADDVASHILSKLAEPFHIHNELIHITTSIGITVYPNDAEEVDVLLKNADQAMYAAKTEGRNCYHYFTLSMQQAAIARMRIANDLRSAITNREFRVYYQPIIELKNGNIHKAEALIRWQHPTNGLVSPAEFIPIAEDTGLIVEIGDYVFMEVADQLAKWKNIYPDFQVSVNKSPVQFRNNNRPQADWMGYLASIGISGERMVIEITEGLLLDAKDPIVNRLKSFRQGGIQIAIDDFGTGYSSLAYLKKFEIDYVKIDQSFVKNIKAGSDDMALCEAIIVMAHTLGFKVIAEGVETIEQRDLLTAVDCDYAQGYLFSRPVPIEAFEQLLAKQP
ncbi:MAG: putative bifunctional diguanylate cyclase/phosphodiesterase [Methylophilaceae bacterium]